MARILLLCLDGRDARPKEVISTAGISGLQRSQTVIQCPNFRRFLCQLHAVVVAVGLNRWWVFWTCSKTDGARARNAPVIKLCV